MSHRKPSTSEQPTVYVIAGPNGAGKTTFDVRRRFVAGARSFWELYRMMVDASWLYDATNGPPELIFVEEAHDSKVVDPPRFMTFEQSLQG